MDVRRSLFNGVEKYFVDESYNRCVIYSAAVFVFIAGQVTVGNLDVVLAVVT